MHHAHPTILETRVWQWADEAACAAFAQRLARQAGLTGAFLTLHGPLGAGKTTFVRHLLRALGVEGRIKSPTYTVMEPHQARGLDIAHFDFYRFNDPREWEDAGFRDVFAGPGLKLAEWPDKAAGALPMPDLALHISPQDPGPAHGAQGRTQYKPEDIVQRAAADQRDLAADDAADLTSSPREVRVEAMTPTGLQLLAALAGAA
jgi:tRNA threonylcarbamoyladenosine biosynthesis protein TsaE